MKRLVALLPLVLLAGIVLLGCEPPAATVGANSTPPGPPAPPGPPGSAAPAASPAPPTSPAAPQPATRPNERPIPLESKAGVFAGTLDDLAAPVSRPSAPSQATSPPPVDPNVERVKAEKGVGIKGRSLDEYEGVVVTPVKAYFAAKERIFFEIEFPANYQTWRVGEDRAPADYEELKAKFLDPLGLTAKMPKLPPGHKYTWDATNEQLMVERPKLKSAP